MIFLTMNDIHISDKNPSARKDDYREAIFDKLKYVRDLTHKHNATATLIAGDLFHYPQPSKVSHSIVRETMEIFSGYYGDVLVIPGNHDIQYNSFDHIDKQPLGVLHQAGVLHILDYGDKQYIGGTDRHVRVTGKHYNETDPLHGFRTERDVESEIVIQLAHLNCSPKGDLFFGDKCYSYEELSKLYFTILVLGHIHTDYGIAQIPGNFSWDNKRYIYNLGSISRGSLSDDIFKREIYCGKIEVIDRDNIICDRVVIPSRKVEEAFDLEKVEFIKKENKLMEEFISLMKTQIEKSSLNSVSSIDIEIENLNLDIEIKNLMREYLERAKAG